MTTSNLSPDILALLAQWQSGQPLPQFAGYTYQPNFAATGGTGYGDAGDGREMYDTSRITQWDRGITGQDGGGRQAFNPDGSYSHDWTATASTPLLRDLAIWAAMAAGVGGAGAALTGQGFASGFGGGLGDAALGGADAAGGLSGGGAVEAAAGAGSSMQLTPAALEAAMGTPGYGFNASAASLGTGALNGAGAATSWLSAADLPGLPPLRPGLESVGPMSTPTADPVPSVPSRGPMTALERFLQPTPLKLAGAALGAYDARNGERSGQTTNSAEPWAPAQPFLQSLLGQGQQLQQHYQQQAFSPALQAAYGNFSGLLNAANRGAAGLLGGATATASGANNYDRNNPRRGLIGSTFDLSSFAPKAMDFFPVGG